MVSGSGVAEDSPAAAAPDCPNSPYHHRYERAAPPLGVGRGNEGCVLYHTGCSATSWHDGGTQLVFVSRLVVGEGEGKKDDRDDDAAGRRRQ